MRRYHKDSHTQQEREAIHELVCQAIESGLTSPKACEAVGVERGTWMGWMSAGHTDIARYAHAREQLGDLLAEGIISDAETLGRTDPAYAKVVVDAKKWVAARLFPKRWGDKVDITSGGEKMSPVAALPANVLINAQVAQIAQLPKVD